MYRPRISKYCFSKIWETLSHFKKFKGRTLIAQNNPFHWINCYSYWNNNNRNTNEVCSIGISRIHHPFNWRKILQGIENFKLQILCKEQRVPPVSTTYLVYIFRFRWKKSKIQSSKCHHDDLMASDWCALNPLAEPTFSVGQPRSAARQTHFFSNDIRPAIDVNAVHWNFELWMTNSINAAYSMILWNHLLIWSRPL